MKLLELCFQDGFKDAETFGLYSSICKALRNIAVDNAEIVLDQLNTVCRNTDNRKVKGYCNNMIQAEKKITEYDSMFPQICITIFGQKYQVYKNGILILAKAGTSFARLLQIKKEITYDVNKERYADYEYFKEIIGQSGSLRNVKWALVFAIDGENVVGYRKAKVEIYESGLKIYFDDTDRNDIREFYRQISENDINFEKLCAEYIIQGNYLVDIKKLLVPYHIDVVNLIKKSLLCKNVERYKKVAQELYFYRPAILNEYARILKNEGDSRDVTIRSLHAKLANIKDCCADLKNKAYNGFDDCMDSFMEEFENNVDKVSDRLCIALLSSKIMYRYLIIFLEQNFYKELNARIRIKPDKNLYEIHMGKNWIDNKSGMRSLYITPRLRNEKWENDNSEIRRTKFQYYTIGHLLETGLVIEQEGRRILKKYSRFEDAVNDFYPIKELEKDEYLFLQCYLEYVKSHKENIKNIPLLIPQFRFAGENLKHRYRADFLILNYCNRNNVRKILIELSRNYLHDTMSENDAIRRNDFIQKYGCMTLEIRDKEMENIKSTFNSRIVEAGYLT